MKNWIKFVISLIGAELIGITSSLVSGGAGSSWFENLAKPVFNPPNWVFAPVWTILYLMIGISFFLVWKNKENIKLKKKAYWIFGIQLALNWFWSIAFFSMNNIGLALLVIILLLISIILNILMFYKISKTSGYLLVPYLLWVSFATVLNYSILMLN